MYEGDKYGLEAKENYLKDVDKKKEQNDRLIYTIEN